MKCTRLAVILLVVPARETHNRLNCKWVCVLPNDSPCGELQVWKKNQTSGSTLVRRARRRVGHGRRARQRGQRERNKLDLAGEVILGAHLASHPSSVASVDLGATRRGRAQRWGWSVWPPVVASSAESRRLRPLEEIGGEAGSGVIWTGARRRHPTTVASPTSSCGALGRRFVVGEGRRGGK